MKLFENIMFWKKTALILLLLSVVDLSLANSDKYSGYVSASNDRTLGDITFNDVSLSSCIYSQYSADTLIQDITNLSCNYKSITDLSGLEQLIHLTSINFNGNIIEDISAIANFPQLRRLVLSANRLSDASSIISLLSGANELTDLNLSLNRIDCAPLYQISLLMSDDGDSFQSDYNEAICDSDNDGLPDRIESLNGLNLLDPSDAEGDLDGDSYSNRQEYIGRSDMRDLSSLPDSTLLVPISDIVINDSLLVGCLSEQYEITSEVGSVTKLECSHRRITDITGLQYFRNLIRISLHTNEIVDVSELSGLDRLEQVVIQSNDISDGQPFIELLNIAPIEILLLLGNEINCRDLYLITEMVNSLEHSIQHSSNYRPSRCDSDDDGITDSIENENGLDPLESSDANGDLDGDGFTNLQEHKAGSDMLNAESLPDITLLVPVSELTFNDNALLTCITEEYGASVVAGEIISLDCYSDDISSLVGLEHLKNMTRLNLTRNQISDIAPISDLIKLENIDFQVNEISNIEPLIELLSKNDSALRSVSIRGNNVACPLLYRARVQALLKNSYVASDYNPSICDSDNDGIVDSTELENGLRPLDASDSHDDEDNDGFTNLEESRGFSNMLDIYSIPGRPDIDFESSEELVGFNVNSIFPWVITSDESAIGSASLRAPDLKDSQSSSLVLEAEFNEGTVSFAYKTSTESIDFLFFMIDGRVILEAYGESDWTTFTAPVSAGTHILTWQFWKDEVYSGGQDTVWIDAISAPFSSPDADSDGISDNRDAFPMDLAASLDIDGDGYPDSWNAGYSAADSSTGLVLDEFPNDSQRWTTVDTDGDGVTDDTETLLSLNINDASDVWQDNDGDRLPLLLERQEATNDSDRDNDVFSESRLLVQQAFVDMAGRFATDTEVNDALAQLSGASSPLDIYVAALDDSSLARLGLVGRIYQALLNRSPDQGGLNFFRRQLQSGGMNNDQIVSGFINSTEFQSRYGNLSNSEFVQLVYQNVLGRSPDPAGLAYWEEQLNSGNTNPTGLMLGFITSQEFIDREDVAQRLNGLSLVMANRSLSQDDINRYRQWVESEGNYRSVIRELLSSQGYREQLLTDVSDATADSDADGRPDGLEFAQGFDASLKDNDVLNDDVMFVQQTLRDVLGYRLSLSEEATQLTALQTANNRSDWVASLISDERVNTNRNAIIRLYNAILGRRSERSGLVFWIERYESGTNTLEDIANAFVGSGEFQSTYGTLSDGDFVNLVYQNVLGRAGDSGGVAYWTSQLDSSAISRGGLMIGFSESSENANLTLNRDRVVVLYTMLLARDPSDAEFVNVLSFLESGTSFEFIVNLVINSDDYQARFY